MFKGQIDDVRIYNQGLSAIEIRKLAVPPLAIALSATDVVLSWTATGITFVLERSEDLSSGLWSPVTQTPIVQDGKVRVALTAAPGNYFYRLKRN